MISFQWQPSRSVSRTYIIAEQSANHGQKFERAIELLRIAKEVGADAVKLQTYTPDTMTIESQAEAFRISGGTAWDGRTLYDLYGEAYTPWEWLPQLQREAERLGIDLFSTAFDASSLAFLEEHHVPMHKIASFEIVDLELIRRAAATRKPLIISTGMASLSEIQEAVDAAREAGCTELALLKCTSAYPAPANEMNLRTIPHMAETFGVPVGLSDHTLGIAVPVAAVAMGATIIEKHFTLARADGGPDAGFSLEPQEFKQMVEAVRQAEAALGQVSYQVTERELASRVFRRSLFIVEDVRSGEPFTSRNVRSIRPGHGLAPKYLELVLSRTASRHLERGTPLAWEHLGLPQGSRTPGEIS